MKCTSEAMRFSVDGMDGVVIGRCCEWVVLKSFAVGETLTDRPRHEFEVEVLRLCTAVRADELEVRRLVPSGDAAQAELEDRYLLTGELCDGPRQTGGDRTPRFWMSPADVVARGSFVRRATADDMRAVEIKYPGVMRLFGFVGAAV